MDRENSAEVLAAGRSSAMQSKATQVKIGPAKIVEDLGLRFTRAPCIYALKCALIISLNLRSWEQTRSITEDSRFGKAIVFLLLDTDCAALRVPTTNPVDAARCSAVRSVDRVVVLGAGCQSRRGVRAARVGGRHARIASVRRGHPPRTRASAPQPGVKLLIDECLAREVAEHLAAVGHDAVHVSDRSLLGHPD